MTYQPIETAPKDGSYVLIWMRYYDTPVIASWNDYGIEGGGRWRACCEHYDSASYIYDSITPDIITHWAPLPTPPESAA